MADERPAGEPDRHAERARGVRLLVADPDLGSSLDGEQFREAREQAVFPSLELAEGTLKIDHLRGAPGVRGQLHGFLVLEGSVTINLRMSGRTCTRLIGPRELVLLDGVETDSIPVNWEWSVHAPARLALLDGRLRLIARRWPPLMGAILERAAQQTRNAFLQQAISQLPRVEERLLALFWSIADRQGVVRPDGVWVSLSATHDTLAHMVGAQRPTVSLGLTRLAEGGLVRAEGDGWLLAPDSADAFDDPATRPDADLTEVPE
jgi:CRP-like cAMP-binding protein